MSRDFWDEQPAKTSEQVSDFDKEMLIILSDYSNDIGRLKMRNGKLPAQAAKERIKVAVDRYVITIGTPLGVGDTCARLIETKQRQALYGGKK